MSLLAQSHHPTPPTPALPPPPPSNVASVRTAVNLSVLKRHIPSVKYIVDSASHAVLYEFEPETREWTKKNVEGAMFIFESENTPSFGFFILNRLGLDNALAYLEPHLVLHQTDEYIMYRSDSQHGGAAPIYGLWIYDPTDRERIWQKLNQLKTITVEMNMGIHHSASLHNNTNPSSTSVHITRTNSNNSHNHNNTKNDHSNSNSNNNSSNNTNKNTADLLEMFRQASLNTFQSTTVTTQSPGMSATHVTNQFDTASNPIDELLRTRSQLLPTAHRPTDNHQHNHGMQMTLPPPPAPISTAFEHYAPEEQRGHAASLLALLTSGHPAATHGPPPIPYYSNQQPLQHQPQREKDLLAVLQPPSNSHNSSHHSNTSNNPAYYQQQPQQPQQLPHTNQLHPSNAPPMALPPHADTAADRALNRLFSRFAPSQSQPLFVQTVLHAVQHDPEFVELFYLLYRHARPVPNSSNSNNTGSGSGGGFNFS